MAAEPSGGSVVPGAVLPDPGADEVAARLADVLGRLTRSVRRSHVTSLGASSASALATVVRSGPLRMGELAEREGVTPATLSRVVSLLEREGFVERTVDPRDRRSTFLNATADGRRLVAELIAARAQRLAARVAGLDEAQRQTLAAGIEVLQRLVSD
jgi:DNA-binding MarR family transcriptional regulator